jgi:hypothetical protein
MVLPLWRLFYLKYYIFLDESHNNVKILLRGIKAIAYISRLLYIDVSKAEVMAG